MTEFNKTFRKHTREDLFKLTELARTFESKTDEEFLAEITLESIYEAMETEASKGNDAINLRYAILNKGVGDKVCEKLKSAGYYNRLYQEPTTQDHFNLYLYWGPRDAETIDIERTEYENQLNAYYAAQMAEANLDKSEEVSETEDVH